jgi:hypothetical protein
MSENGPINKISGKLRLKGNQTFQEQSSDFFEDVIPRSDRTD